VHNNGVPAGSRSATHHRLKIGGGRQPRGSRQHAMPKCLSVPCGDARPEWSGPHAFAYEGGSHAFWRACGCSAGRSACSRHGSYRVNWGVVKQRTNITRICLRGQIWSLALAVRREQARLHLHGPIYVQDTPTGLVTNG
jgi:hypothetical protein